MDAFSSVEPLLPDLKLYCRTLAMNEWDAEDLMQEVLTKVYRSLQQKPDRLVSKSFLRQIAKNAWIDHCRKQRGLGATTVFDEDLHQASPAVLKEMFIRESLEQLADQLNPRQMVLLLVVDIFQFSASETAELLHTSVGAIKEGLKRARLRLQALVSGMSGQASPRKSQPHMNMSKEIFEKFLSAFRAGDPEAICRTYLALAANGIHIEKANDSLGKYFFTFRDPNGHLLGFFQEA